MIGWLKRLIAGRELDELEMRRAVMEGLELGRSIASAMTGKVNGPYGGQPWTPPSPPPRRYTGRLAGIELTPVPPRRQDATLWDVAQAGEMSESGRVEYRFLGVTGEEEA